MKYELKSKVPILQIIAFHIFSLAIASLFISKISIINIFFSYLFLSSFPTIYYFHMLFYFNELIINNNQIIFSKIVDKKINLNLIEISEIKSMRDFFVFYFSNGKRIVFACPRYKDRDRFKKIIKKLIEENNLSIKINIILN